MKRHVLASALLGILAAGAHPLAAQWKVRAVTDPMTDDVVHAAISAPVESLHPMPSPYAGTTARLSFECSGFFEWVRVWFSVAPNLSGTQGGNGRDLVRARVRWGEGSADDVTLRQNWGSKFLRFVRSQPTIERLLSEESMLLELNWFGAGRTFFRLPLEGAPGAVAKAREQCVG